MRERGRGRKKGGDRERGKGRGERGGSRRGREREGIRREGRYWLS